MKIVVLDAKTLGELDFSGLKGFGDYKIFQTTRLEERIEHIGKAEIIITNKVIIDKFIMDSCPDLKLVCLTATGMNNVDLLYAAEKGIVVKNVAGYSTESVVQQTFAMMFHLLHSNRYYDNYTRSGEYALSDIFTHIGPRYYELKGKQWGIIGLGTIGKRVAEIARVFGCNVVYYSTSGKNVNSEYQRVTLDVLLKNSDIVSIHAPLNDSTRGLISEKELSMMKSSAIIINVGRGGIVNEKELSLALDRELIAGAALDVLEKEPIDVNNHLLHIQNKDRLFITPHIAWISLEAIDKLWMLTLDNVRNFLNQ